MKKSSEGISLFYSLVDDFDETAPLIPFSGSLKLSAVPGEEREYKILVHVFRDNSKINERQFPFIIDKKAPSPPGISKIPGEYKEDFSILFKKGDAKTVYYSLNEEISGKAIFWDGNYISLTARENESRTYVVRAYSIDEVGNRSPVVSFRYLIDKTSSAAIEPFVDIVSPVAGTFSNKQLLYLQYNNVSWIKYSIDGSDPLVNGTFYTGPVILDLTGEVVLNVTAVSRWGDGQVIKQSVKYNVSPDSSNVVSVDKESGIYSGDLLVNLTLGGNTKFYYTSDGGTPDFNSTITMGALSLSGADKTLSVKELRFKALLSGTLFSGEYRYLYIIDNRSLKEPVINLVDSSGDRIRFSVSSPEGTEVHYTTDGFTPGFEDFPVNGEFSVEPEAIDSRGLLLVKALAVDGESNKSNVAYYALEFPVPEVKELSSEDIVTSLPVSGKINITASPDEKLFYELTSNGLEPGDPDIYSTALAEDFVLDLPFGGEKLFKLKISRMERNRIVDTQQYNYTIDRKPPSNPVILGLPEKKITNNSISFYFSPEEGSIFYQFTEDGSAPVIQADTARKYFLPVKLPGREDKEIIYRINAIAVDELGNKSFMVQERSIAVDLDPPSVPPEPQLHSSGTSVEQRYHIYWETEEGNSIFYQLQNDPRGTVGFLLYTQPILVDFTQRGKSLFIQSYQEDRAGNKSEKVTFEINPVKRRKNPPIVLGVEDNGVYNQRVSLKFLSSEGNVHYEYTTDGSIPGEVKYNSPAAGRQLVLDAEAGQTCSYILRAKAFNPSVRNISSEEVMIRFTIDKTPPAPPMLKDIRDNGYYYDKKFISFEKTETSVFYSVNKSASGNVIPSGFKVFQEDIPLDVDNGEVGCFKVMAFTMDKAGNISREIPVWRFSIDKNAIYVSPLGNDLYIGTREQPFRTLKKALLYSNNTNRKIILLASGVYELEKTMDIPGNLEIRGSFNPRTWELEGSGDPSVITSGSLFKGEQPLLKVNAGAVKLNAIAFKDLEKKVSSLVLVSGGDLSIEDCEFYLPEGGNLNGVQFLGTGIGIRNSVFTASSGVSGSFISARGGEVVIDSSDFDGPDNSPGFTALKLQSTKAELSRLEISPGTGEKTSSIDSRDGVIDLLDSKIDTGAGKKNAVAMNLFGGIVRVSQSIINGNSDARYVLGILTNSTDFSIKESIINVDGKFGATGLKITGGEFLVDSCRIKGSKTQEFLYLLNINKSTGKLYNNVIRGAVSGDSLCAVLDNTESLWVNNTILGGSGSNITGAFVIKGNYLSDFYNNIIVREGFDSGVAFHLIGDGKINFRILNNNFTGWRRLVQLDYIPVSTVAAFNPGIFDIASVEALNTLDGDHLGGVLHQNISENFFKTFQVSKQEDYHLSEFSACVDTGYDISIFEDELLSRDFEGQTRPAEGVGISPLVDIGADEMAP